MFKPSPLGQPQHITFVLVPEFSFVAFSSMIEAMRLANYVNEKTLYQWQIASIDTDFVEASNGVRIQIDKHIETLSPQPNVVICSGLNVRRYCNSMLLRWLRDCDRQGAHIGGICTASWILAWSGLMKNYRCTIHWMNIESFREEFPDIEVTTDLFEIDRQRFSCAGGTTPVDMMLQDIEKQYGRDLALQVCGQFMHERLRTSEENDILPLQSRLHIKHPRLLQAIAIMEQNIENVMSHDHIAESIGLSRRQMERLFRFYIGTSPARYYAGLRLKKAQRLLCQTSLSVTEIAFACGFSSASHFSKCYREFFHYAPRFERRMHGNHAAKTTSQTKKEKIKSLDPYGVDILKRDQNQIIGQDI